MKIATLFILVWVLIAGCRKETLVPISDPKLETPAVYVDVFNPGDTTNGIAHALKNQSVWQASGGGKSGKYNDLNFWTLSFSTYADDLESIREHVVLTFIPDDCAGKTFIPKKYVNGEYTFTCFYTRAYSDGDLFIDRYKLDTTATDNYLHINRLDRIRKRMEGDFTISFNIVEPRRDPLNPKKIKFSSGRFAVKLPD